MSYDGAADLVCDEDDEDDAEDEERVVGWKFPVSCCGLAAAPGPCQSPP